MKHHIPTIILLLLAVIAFVLHFFAHGVWLVIYNIAAFVLPTIATVIEIILSVFNKKKTEEELKKRAVWKALSQEEYDQLVAEGKVDPETYYATFEE